MFNPNQNAITSFINSFPLLEFNFLLLTPYLEETLFEMIIFHLQQCAQIELID